MLFTPAGINTRLTKLIFHYKDLIDDYKNYYKIENEGLDELTGVDTTHWYV